MQEALMGVKQILFGRVKARADVHKRKGRVEERDKTLGEGRAEWGEGKDGNEMNGEETEARPEAITNKNRKLLKADQK